MEISTFLGIKESENVNSWIESLQNASRIQYESTIHEFKSFASTKDPNHGVESIFQDFFKKQHIDKIACISLKGKYSIIG